MSTGKTNKRRGFSFEREVVNQAKDAGLDAERAYASNGRALGECEQVDCKVAGVRLQCKRVKTLAAKYRIPDGCDAVVFREDRGETLALIPFDYFIKLHTQQHDCIQGQDVLPG